MHPDFSRLNLNLEFTEDGSPTLRTENDGESMHHSGGAASETRYIYQSVIDQAYKILPNSKTTVVGLGLGYIEICWAKNSACLPGQLTSFEVHEGLKNNFNEWFISEKISVYDAVCKSLKIEDMDSIKVIKRKLQKNFEIKSIQGNLLEFKDSIKWNIICYDAYSSKTNQELWSEEFLDSFIHKHAESDCVLTTYACTGVLKRVLIRNGFRFIKRPGFRGKRDSSLALRGVFDQKWTP